MPAFAATSSAKMLTLTVGQCDTFTDTEYTALGNSKATDFVIIPGSAGTYGGTESGYKTNLAPKVINIINKILAKRSTAKIWIGTPGIDSNNYTTYAGTSATPFYNYITYVRNQIGTTKWANVNVYMNEEAVYGTVDYNNITGNSTIKLMNDLSYKVRSVLGKKFLWIPYGYASDVNKAATIIKNIGYVSDKYTIFDYVIIQPHYYFDSTCQAGLNSVYYSVKNQKVCYANNVAVLSTKGSSTVIGAEMEFNWKIVPPNSYSDYQARYNQYVSKFSEFKGSYPFAFYWDGWITYHTYNKTQYQGALEAFINSFYNY
jgi:hypothetical protein